jgi:hypothetical protein
VKGVVVLGKYRSNNLPWSMTDAPKMCGLTRATFEGWAHQFQDLEAEHSTFRLGDGDAELSSILGDEVDQAAW